MMWRYADGTLSLGFWYAAAVALLMVASGVWGLVAPESFRAFYFNLLRRLRRVGVGRRATTNQLIATGSRPIGIGWSSHTSIRFWSVVEIGLAAGFMTWVIFFTAPGVAY